MKHKQNKKSDKTLSTTTLSVVGYALLFAVLWTIPFDMYKLIGGIFSPDAFWKSSWIYELFVFGTLGLGVALLTWVDILRKRNIGMSLLKWFIVVTIIYYVSTVLLIELY